MRLGGLPLWAPRRDASPPTFGYHTHTQPTSRSQRNPLVRLRPPEGPGCAALRCTCGVKGSYLVDPASSHMLVSKIKPCMSKYKLLYTVKLRMAH
jgi:hypothetical protein